jgi:hypothetical protein
MAPINKTQKCTHPVPDNAYGIFAMHCQDNVPIEGEGLKKVFEGPIAEMEDDYEKTLAKPASAEDPD